ncbi:MAG: hypothetical protein J2P17_19370, partial [Mycobacterium sp.]|nr:hypothetical protein [Mycobacterium sp.]
RKTTYTYDKLCHLMSQTEPDGNLTSTSGDYTTSYGYDEIYERTSITNAKGDKITYAYDDAGNLSTVVDPRKNATTDTGDYTTKYSYDLNHRIKVITDAKGYTTGSTYDRDGLVTATADQNNTTTIITLDARGKPSQVKAPHADGIDNITQYEYDQVGNQTKVITPRGAATAGVPDDFIRQTNYDELNRIKEELTPYNPSDPRYNTPDKTTYSYDPVGRLATVSAPPSNGQTVRNDTTYTYFDNGWTKESTDPWDIVTRYDYNDIGKQISRTLTSGGGSSSRTMGWGYYPDGKLESRTDDGVPVGLQVTLVDDSDSQNAGSTGGTWTSSTAGTGFQGYDYATHAAGTGTSSFVWNLSVPQDGDYNAYVKYPAVSGAATNASYKVTYSGGSATKTVNQSSGAGTWVSLGKYTFKRDPTAQQQITLSDAATAGATVLADAVKLVRDNTADTDNEKKDFTYGYDANGNLTEIGDNSPGAAIDDYTVSYTGLDQVAEVKEKNSGTVKHTTTYTYDENGNPATRDHDTQSAIYSYDERDLLAKVTDQESPTAMAKVTTNTYTPTRQRLHEVKGNGNTVDYAYFLDQLPQHQIEKNPAGALVAEHTLAYDPNGNKTQDITTMMNADNTSAYLTHTLGYSYDPLDRIAKVTRDGATAE